MNRLVVMSHFDATGGLASHTRRHIDSWDGVASKLVFVSTSPLDDESRFWLQERAIVIERENVGYDFMSYKTGLDSVQDSHSFDEIVICNDSFVGPLTSYRQIFDEMESRNFDFWGITKSKALSPHVQSYFVVFRKAVIESAVFRNFWGNVAVLQSKWGVIKAYEIGLSQTLIESGFKMGSYFNPTPVERILARSRLVWAGLLANQQFWKGRRKILKKATAAWNPPYTLPDRAIPYGKLPVVKLEIFRVDPYALGGERLLQQYERDFPEFFADVSSFVEKSRAAYRIPKSKKARKRKILNWIHPLVRYKVRK